MNLWNEKMAPEWQNMAGSSTVDHRIRKNLQLRKDTQHHPPSESTPVQQAYSTPLHTSHVSEPRKLPSQTPLSPPPPWRHRSDSKPRKKPAPKRSTSKWVDNKLKAGRQGLLPGIKPECRRGWGQAGQYGTRLINAVVSAALINHGWTVSPGASL